MISSRSRRNEPNHSYTHTHTQSSSAKSPSLTTSMHHHASLLITPTPASLPAFNSTSSHHNIFLPPLHRLSTLPRLHISGINPIIPTLSLNFLHNFLHLLNLLLPLLLAQLRLLMEKLHIRLPITSSQPIPKRRELAVVIVEVQMMHRMACCTVDKGRVGNVFAVVCRASVRPTQKGGKSTQGNLRMRIVQTLINAKRKR